MASSTLEREAPAISPAEADAARRFYEMNLLPKVLSEENFGKILVLDVDTKEYWIDRSRFGAEVAMRLSEERPMARIYHFRIGYDGTYGYISPVQMP